MSMNDPIGDMLTRIRNAQMRGKSTVATPASKLRAWVLDVLAGEGYIRGYEKTTGADGQAGNRNLAEVLRRHPGDPRTQARVQTGSPRVMPPSRIFPRSAMALAFPSSPRPRASCRTRPHAPPMLAAKFFAPCSEEGNMSRIGKKPVDAAQRRKRLGKRAVGRSEGAERHPQLHRNRRCDDHAGRRRRLS